MNATRVFGKILFGSAADARAVQAAIDAGNDINAGDNADRWTALHYALTPVSYPPDLAVVGVLVANVASINRADRRGWTPLHFAARTGSREIIVLLLDAGADPNIADAKGITPFHRYLLRPLPKVPAGAARDPETVRLFIKHGARPTDGLRSFVRACVFENKAEVLSLLGEDVPKVV